ncbi:MAG: hypothetical protein RLY31_2299 [Bacteroidota bacterium]|jgi:hypothetical protein
MTTDAIICEHRTDRNELGEESGPKYLRKAYLASQLFNRAQT